MIDDFIFGAWGKSIWGSDADKQSLDTDLSIVRGNFTDVPIVIGEWSASSTYTETAARWKYFDFLIRTAAKYTTATILWDNGEDQLDRAAGKWRDPTVISVLANAFAGVNNSLADSTEDVNAPTQETSADIFHSAGTDVADVSLPYLLNGNTVKSISGPAGPLKEGTEYSVDGTNITYHAPFLSNYFSNSTAPGLLANLTLEFSQGTPLNAAIVQYDTPTLGSSSAAASSVASGSDLVIPITWKGLEDVAAVKAQTTDGTYLVDSWTEYLGPLQQGRMTYSSQYNWDGSTVTITSSAVQSVVATGQTTVFTFEFYPRVPGNAVNFTLTV